MTTKELDSRYVAHTYSRFPVEIAGGKGSIVWDENGKEYIDLGSGIGFRSAGRDLSQDRRSVLEKAVRKSFPPEFINRVDEQVFFNPLTKEDITKIIDIELKDLRARALEAGYKLSVTPAAKRLVADAGYDPSYGARPLKRAVTRFIEDPVSEFIITERLLQKSGTTAVRTLTVGLSDNKESTAVSLKEP